jgi:hypothetical protein
MPSWRTADSVDLSQHVFFHKLKPGANDREALYALTSRLHEPMLDRSRPLWEVHVIAGLWDRQFAIYYKMHHAVADGITMTRWGVDSLRTTPDDDTSPVWTFDHSRRGGHGRKQRPTRPWPARSGNSSPPTASAPSASAGSRPCWRWRRQADQERHRPALHGQRRHALHRQRHAGQFATAAVPMAASTPSASSRATLNRRADLPGRRHAPLPGRRRRHAGPPDHDPDAGEPAPRGREGGGQQDRHHPGRPLAADDAYVRLRNVGYSLRNVRAMIDASRPSRSRPPS